MKQQTSKQKLLNGTDSMVFDPQNQKKRFLQSSKNNRIVIFLKFLISYELNYQSLLREIDKQNVEQILQISKRAPGYKSLCLIFCYYLKRVDIFSAFTISLIFPIPLSAFVYYLGIFINSYQYIGQYLQIGIIGLRCCVISYLLRYCLHFPQEKFYWIIYLFSILIGVVFNHNYVFILIYVMGIFFSIYKRQDVRNSNSIDNQRMQEKQLSEQQKKIKIKRLAHPQIALYFLIGFFIFLWILGKFFDNKEYGHLIELFVVGLLSSSQQTSIFFPAFATKFIYEFGFHKRLMIGDLYALGFIIPGLHLKSYMLLLDNHNIASITLSFLALYLPTLLLVYIFLGYRSFFYSVQWKNITKAMQSVSNGLILVTIIELVREQTCHFNIVFYTSIVLFTVTKLYRLNQIIAAILGIFLVASRASVLHFSNKVKIQNFLCWTEK